MSEPDDEFDPGDWDETGGEWALLFDEPFELEDDVESDPDEWEEEA